jgi:hypothetical protein
MEIKIGNTQKQNYKSELFVKDNYLYCVWT